MSRAVSFILAFLFICFSCEHIEHKATYRILRTGNWDQIALYGAEKNVLGFSDDLIYEIATREGFRVNLGGFDKQNILQALDIKEVDAVLTSVQPTPNRMLRYIFSDPYFSVGPVLMIRKDAAFKNLYDLSHRAVAYERSYTWPLTLPGASDCVFHPYDDILRAVEDVSRGVVDAVVLDAIVANRLAAGLYSNTLKVAGPPLIPLGLYLVVKKGKNEELIHLFNEELEKLKKEGLYSKMLFYWGLADDQNHHVKIPST